MVVARGLVVGYEGTAVTRPLDLTVAAGDVVAVVDGNGSGKSTLLRTVAGRQAPLAGSLTVLGEPVDERRAAFRAAVAVDLGEDAFLPSVTAREHLLLTAYGHGLDDVAPATDAVLAEFGLTDRAHVSPAALSSGQRRRLLLAAVFLRPRRLVVLDEPEQRLDAPMRRTLARRLVAEREAGGAVLLASHDADLVATAATGVVEL